MTFKKQTIELLYKYLNEYQEGFLQKAWKNHKGFSGYGYFESYLAYCYMREYKPLTTVDIGSACGFSAYPLNFACARNKWGVVLSYELNEERCVQYRENMIQNDLKATIFSGEVEKNIQSTLFDKAIDILFMDAAHSKSFAEWYLKELVPKTATLLHIHDVAYLPDDGEIKTVLAWLEQNPHLEVVRSWELAYKNGDISVKKPSELVKELNTPKPSTVNINNKEVISINHSREVRGEANSSIWVKLS